MLSPSVMEGTLEELRRISNCPEGATFSQLGLRKSVDFPLRDRPKRRRLGSTSEKSGECPQQRPRSSPLLLTLGCASPIHLGEGTKMQHGKRTEIKARWILSSAMALMLSGSFTNAQATFRIEFDEFGNGSYQIFNNATNSYGRGSSRCPRLINI